MAIQRFSMELNSKKGIGKNSAEHEMFKKYKSRTAINK
jgi:hypothetical protein